MIGTIIVGGVACAVAALLLYLFIGMVHMALCVVWYDSHDCTTPEPRWVKLADRLYQWPHERKAKKPKRDTSRRGKRRAAAPAKVEESPWEQLRKAHRQREAEARWQWNMDFRGDWPEGTDLVWVPPHLMNPEFCPTLTQGHCLCTLIQYPMSDLPPDTRIVHRDTWDGEPDSPHELFGWHYPSSAYIFHKMRPPIYYPNALFGQVSQGDRERLSRTYREALTVDKGAA